MVSTLRQLFTRMIPATPACVRDDLLRLRYGRFTQMLPIFHIMVILITFASCFSALDSNSNVTRISAPVFIFLLTSVRLFTWFRRRGLTVEIDVMAQRVKGFWVTSVVLTVIASGWIVGEWLNADVNQRGNLPILIILGAIMTLGCNIVHRAAASCTIVFAVVPISCAMLLNGTRVEALVGGCILVLVVLQTRMILQHHEQLVQGLISDQQTRLIANTDMLTGIANRRAFVAAVETRLTNAGGEQFSILMIDLNGFKQVNDRYGHMVGDELIQAVASRLRSFESDAVLSARLGGDEFGIMATGVGNATDRDGLVIALSTALSKPYQVDEQALTVCASIGAASYPENGNTFAALMQTADRALYAAKPTAKPSGRLTAQPVSIANGHMKPSRAA